MSRTAQRQGVDEPYTTMENLEGKDYYALVYGPGVDEVVLATADGARAVGTVQHGRDGSLGTTGFGQAVRVRGGSEFKMSGTFTKGDPITTAANGMWKVATVGEFVNGFIEESGVDGDIASGYFTREGTL